MAKSESNRLAKNAIYMYMRMGIVILISIYSSRVLLKYLGVEDYGIYNLVGSIIALVSMLQGMFISSSQRFLNYEMGRNNIEKIKVIFNINIRINLIIALAFFIAIETLGLWFFEYKINIDIERIYAAKWVFHLAVISSIINIFTYSFDSMIIAYERMGFYAILSILRNLLNLLIIFLLPYFGKDKLITYGILLLIISVIISVITIIYCRNKFKECRFANLWDKIIFKQMFFFSVWQMFGTTAYSLTQNGLNLVFNVFGGVTVNAARGIAYQFYTIMSSFLNNVVLVITPYSVKTCASGNIEKTMNMFYFSSKVLFVINLCIVIPFLNTTPEILMLWLGTIPEYTIEFIQIVLIWSTIRSLHYPFDILFKSIGKIKIYQITEGIVLSLPLLVSYLLLKYGFSFNMALSSIIIFEMIDIICLMFIANKVINLKIEKYIFILIHAIFCFCIEFIIFGVINTYNTSMLISLAISFIIDLFILFYFYKMILSKDEKKYINHYVCFAKSVSFKK